MTDKIENHEIESASTAGEGTEVVRSIPQPPKAGRSRKRPCAKQGVRKQESRQRGKVEGRQNSGRKEGRKLNTYALDLYTGTIITINSLEDIKKGMRVVEQPVGSPRPSINAFYDAKLLPEGSTIIPHWGYGAAELDQQLVARLGRLSRLAGYGKQARETMFDQLARSADPSAAMQYLIKELGGPGALTDAPGSITTSKTRDELAALVALSINAGNAEPVEFTEILPTRLSANQRITDAFKEMPGEVESIETDGDGCVIRVRGQRHEDKSVICNILRAAGAKDKSISIKNSRKAYVVSASLPMTALEAAAAATGKPAACVYRVTEEGYAVAHYEVSLNGRAIITPEIPCDPSIISVRALVKEAAKNNVELAALLEQVAVSFEEPSDVIAWRVGPARTVEEVNTRAGQLTAVDILGEEYLEKLANAPRTLTTGDKRRVSVEYKGGFAVLDEMVLHPTDLRAVQLPTALNEVEEDMPVMVTEIRFESRNGSGRPRVVADEITVEELLERRENLLERKGPRAAVLVECRENFLADATRAMALSLTTPRKTAEEVRDPERLAKSITLNNHVSPYLSEGGALVQLVSVLAAGQGEDAWVSWCRDRVKEFAQTSRQQVRSGGKAPASFFDGISDGETARTLLTQAGIALLSERLGEEASEADLRGLESELREVIEKHRFTPVDRGRALAGYMRRAQG
jgi:hypothetical protein